MRLDLTKPVSVYNSGNLPHIDKAVQPMTGSELAANVAWRRSQVKELLSSSKQPGVSNLPFPNTPTTSNSATPSKISAKYLRSLTASLPPIAQQQPYQKPKSADSSASNFGNREGLE